MTKRILQVNMNNTGGAFSLVYQVSKKLLPEYIFDYYSPDKFIKNDVYNDLINSGSNLYESGIYGKKLFKQTRKIIQFYKWLKCQPYQIVHIHTDTAWKMCVYAIPASLLGRIVIAHSHSNGINGHHPKINLFLHKITKPFLIRAANVYCACSKEAAGWMYGSAASNSVIIRNGIDVEKYLYSAKNREFRNKYNISDDTILIGIIGDFSRAKNVEFFIEVFDQLKQLVNQTKKSQSKGLYGSDQKDIHSRHYKLICIGDGKNKSRIEDLVREKGLSEDAIFTGNITNVSKAVSALDIFVMPSIFEGYGLSAVEAQVSGAYCILSNAVNKSVKCSEYCIFLDIGTANITKWAECIIDINLDYDRCDYPKYLKMGRVDIHRTADDFKKVYENFV